MTLRPRTIAFAVGAFVIAALGWAVAGWIARLLGLDELDLPARAGGVVLALSLAEAAVSRFAGNG